MPTPEVLRRIKPANIPAPRKCPKCGCSQNRACWTKYGFGCWWVMSDAGEVICSCCFDPSIRIEIGDDE